jgi:hypothetical protein
MPWKAIKPFSVTFSACLNISIITYVMFDASGASIMWPTLMRITCNNPHNKSCMC